VNGADAEERHGVGGATERLCECAQLVGGDVIERVEFEQSRRVGDALDEERLDAEAFQQLHVAVLEEAGEFADDHRDGVQCEQDGRKRECEKRDGRRQTGRLDAS
jgi:hypothetical protein